MPISKPAQALPSFSFKRARSADCNNRKQITASTPYLKAETLRRSGGSRGDPLLAPYEVSYSASPERQGLSLPRRTLSSLAPDRILSPLVVWRSRHSLSDKSSVRMRVWVWSFHFFRRSFESRVIILFATLLPLLCYPPLECMQKWARLWHQTFHKACIGMSLLKALRFKGPVYHRPSQLSHFPVFAGRRRWVVGGTASQTRLARL